MASSTKAVSGEDTQRLATHRSQPGKRLIASFGDERVAIWGLDQRGRFSVGRDPSADWVLRVPSISRLHAAISVSEFVTIEDLASLNGVVVGSRRLRPGEKMEMVAGQVVQLGDVGITLLDLAKQSPASPSRPQAPGNALAACVVLDPVMVDLHALARSVAAGNISVLLTGETGSGKEVLAALIHRNSPRADKPFLSLNCAALSETLLESELFGHERGAFTGATQSKAGLLEAAEGGTVFLDEIGEMPAALQAKLLRVLEQRQVTRVGGLKPKDIDVRFISATNRDPEAEVERGSFRRDLFYRINGATLFIPPLRQRPSEVEPLARLFAARAARDLGLDRTPEIAADAMQRLLQHAWPGNIRELRNVIDRAVLLCRAGSISEPDLAIMQKATPTEPMRRLPANSCVAPAYGVGLRNPEDAEDSSAQTRIMEALSRCGGNQTRAAKMLGIARQTLIRRITEYHLPRPKRGDPGLPTSASGDRSEGDPLADRPPDSGAIPSRTAEPVLAVGER